MILTPERLQALLQERFPICTEPAELHVVEVDEGEQGELLLKVELLCFERDELGRRRVVDLRQQLVFFVPFAARTEPARVAALARALSRVLPPLLEGYAQRGMIPSDLFPTDVLGLARAETEEDFVRALQAKSRLGRLLARLGL